MSEIHIIVHALKGDVLDPEVLEEMCEFLHDVYAEQQRTGACIPLGSLQPVNLTHFAPLTIAPTAPAPAPAAPAPAPATASEMLQCTPPLSIFNVRETLHNLGYGPYLAALDELAPQMNQRMLDTAAGVCSLPEGARGVLLCEGGRDAPLPCDAAACAGGGAGGPPRCVVGGADPCAVLTELQPTPEEIAAVAAIPDTPAEAAGCAALDVDGLAATVRAFRVLRTWAARAPSVAAAAAVVDALLSADFAAAPTFSNSSAVTRLVFGVPRSVGDNKMGQYAAAATTRRSSPRAAFVWRQWSYFDLYASHALMRDVGFSAGSLAFLFVYTLTQIGSFLLTLAIVASILCTLPLALLVYVVGLGVRWIGVLHFLGIFVILGIGADDVFVVLEHWKVRAWPASATPALRRLSCGPAL
jgi:hypothetical protein